jgi:hypothetical protein
MQTLQSSVAAAQLADRQTAARTARFTSPRRSSSASPRQRLVLRRAAARDDAAVARLAQLDSASRPAGALLVAEIDDEIVAAVPVAGGRAIADPFVPTAELVALLRAQTALLAVGSRGPRLPRLRVRLPHLRAA